jgi:long-chain fatty acid transport protein
MTAAIRTATFAFVGLLAADASATGLSTARFGGEYGTPMSTNPTALYYNPGALGASPDVDIFLDANVAWRTASYQRTAPPGCEAGSTSCTHPQEVPEPSDAVGANNGSASLTNVATAPMIGVSVRIPIGENFAIAGAVGFFVPFGGSSSWSSNETFAGSPYAGAVDGTQRWYSIDGTLRALTISDAIAVSLTKYAHIGISGGATITQVDTIRARELSGTNDVRLEGRSWIEASSIDPNLGFGALVTPFGNHDLRLGISYQLPVGLTYEPIRVKGLVRKIAGGSGAVSGDQEGADDIEMTVSWPDIIRFGAAFRPIRELELRLFGDYTFWSRNQHNCIVTQPAGSAERPCKIAGDGSVAPDGGNPNDYVVNIPRLWEDAVAIRAGLSYWFTPDIELLIGGGYDGNAIPDSTLAADILDFHDGSVAVGGRFKIIDQLAANLTYTQFFYISRDNTAKSQTHLLAQPSAQPDAGGKYAQSIGVVNVNLEVTFDAFRGGFGDYAGKEAEPELERPEEPTEEPTEEPVDEPIAAPDSL